MSTTASRGIANRAPSRCTPSATRPSRCGVVQRDGPVLGVVPAASAAADGSPVRARASASSTSRSTSTAPELVSPVSSTARRARARCAAASPKASRARSARAAERAQRIARSAAVERDGGRAVPGQIGRPPPETPRAWRCSSASAMRWCSASRCRDRECGGDGLPEQVVGEPARRGPLTVARVPDQDARPHALARRAAPPRPGSIPHTSARTSGISSVPATAAASTSARPSADSRSTRRATKLVGRGGNRARGLGRIGEELDELAGEERVTAGAAVHLGGPPVGRGRPGRVGDQLDHLVARQPVQLHRFAVLGQLGQRRGRCRRRARRAGTHRRPPAAPAGTAGRRTAAAPSSTRRPTAGRRARREPACAGRAVPGTERRRRTAAAARRRRPTARRSGRRRLPRRPAPGAAGPARRCRSGSPLGGVGPDGGQQVAQGRGPGPERGCPFGVGAGPPADLRARCARSPRRSASSCRCRPRRSPAPDGPARWPHRRWSRAGGTTRGRVPRRT